MLTADPDQENHEGALAACAIDVLNQRLDRAPAPSCVRPIPPLGAEARAGVSLCVLSEVTHGVVDDRGACAVGHCVSSADDPRHPCIIALECGGGSQGGPLCTQTKTDL